MKIVTKRVLYQCFELFWQECGNMTIIGKAEWLFSNELRHRIITMTAPGVAAEYSANGQIAAFDGAVFGNSLYTILTAGRGIATGSGCVRRNN